VARLKLRLPELFSPAGAGIILICFFLPWVRVSCGGRSMTMSGANLGGVFWIVAILAAIMLGSYIYFKTRRSSYKSKMILLGGAVVSVIVIVFQTIRLVYYTDIPFYIPSAMIGFRVKLGAWGIILGHIMIIASAQFMRKTDKVADNTSNCE
jgi:hypothetical protein